MRLAVRRSLSKREVGAMRASGARLQMINGCHDLVAGLGYVQSLARRLRCPLILTGAQLSLSP